MKHEFSLELYHQHDAAGVQKALLALRQLGHNAYVEKEDYQQGDVYYTHYGKKIYVEVEQKKAKYFNKILLGEYDLDTTSRKAKPNPRSKYTFMFSDADVSGLALVYLSDLPYRNGSKVTKDTCTARAEVFYRLSRNDLRLFVVDRIIKLPSPSELLSILPKGLLPYETNDRRPSTSLQSR